MGREVTGAPGAAIQKFCSPRMTKVTPHLVIRPLLFVLGVQLPKRFVRPATGGLRVSRPLVRHPPARIFSQSGPQSTPILYLLERRIAVATRLPALEGNFVCFVGLGVSPCTLVIW